MEVLVFHLAKNRERNPAITANAIGNVLRILHSANVDPENPPTINLRELLRASRGSDGYLEYLKVLFAELRRKVRVGLWRDAPHDLGTQMLFQMKLTDVGPRFFIPIQMAVMFFPPLVVYQNIADMTFLDIQGRPWAVTYEY